MDHERLAKFLAIPENPVETSRAGFEALLSAQRNTSVIERDGIQSLLAYLQSADNEPEARLTSKTLRWLQERSASEECVTTLVHVIKQKLALDTILEVEVGDIVQTLRHRRHANQHIRSIAGSLSQQRAQNVLTLVTRQVLETAEGAERLAQLHDWLACLRACSSIAGFRCHLDEGWSSIYAAVSEHVQPSTVAEHFSKLGEKQASMVLLRHWVPRLTQDPTESLPALMRSRTAKRLRFHTDSLTVLDQDALAADLESLHKERSSMTSTYQDRPLINLVQVLAQHRLPYAAVLREICAIYSQTEPISELRSVFKDLARRPHVDIPTDLATNVVQSFLALSQPAYALQVFRAVPTISLSDCFELPLQMIEMGKLHSHKMFTVLSRQTQHDTVDPKNRGAHKLSLSQEHVDLVHLVAYACAESPHVPSRVAFRRVWECYRFLRDRTAPLDSLLSRAMVKAGISRPLSEGTRPSAAQTAYVVQIVHKLEGREVAKRLDELVFAVGQGIARGHENKSGSALRAFQAQRESADEVETKARYWKLKGWTIKMAGKKARRDQGGVADAGMREDDAPNTAALEVPEDVASAMDAGSDTSPSSRDGTGQKRLLYTSFGDGKEWPARRHEDDSVSLLDTSSHPRRDCGPQSSIAGREVSEGAPPAENVVAMYDPFIASYASTEVKQARCNAAEDRTDVSSGPSDSPQGHIQKERDFSYESQNQGASPQEHVSIRSHTGQGRADARNGTIRRILSSASGSQHTPAQVDRPGGTTHYAATAEGVADTPQSLGNAHVGRFQYSRRVEVDDASATTQDASTADPAQELHINPLVSVHTASESEEQAALECHSRDTKSHCESLSSTRLTQDSDSQTSTSQTRGKSIDQRHAKYLARKSFKARERKAQAKGAGDWQAFAGRARRERWRTGYDTWTEETR